MPDYLSDISKWSDSLEGKRQDRWILEIDGIPSYLLKTAERPKGGNGVIEIDYINSKRKFKGKSTWDSISITLHDPINDSGAKKVLEWNKLHHDAQTNSDGYKADYTKDINLKLLSPTGTVIENWLYKNAFIETFDYGGLDYSSDAFTEINLTLSYDYAELVETAA